MSFVKAYAVLALTLGLVAPVLADGGLNPAGNPVGNPVGTWQTASGEARYQVSLCGDGTQLCAELTWLRPDVRTPGNMAMLNTLVVNGARPMAGNKWRGEVRYGGQIVDGSMTLHGQDRMTLSGCKLIACRKFDFVRL